MIVLRTADSITSALDQARHRGESIGFVPTMGALHEGHVSLINAARAESGFTVCSIFVNPAQFNDPADYDKYPITTDADISLLADHGTSALYLPAVHDVYPNGFQSLEKYDLGYLETILEGKYRPGHFQGVCQVMRRLLELVRPDHLYMGQKDYQQCMVVKRLLRLTGMDASIQFHMCATVREQSGLAMSSRNMRLSSEGRERAVAISAALMFIKNNLEPGNLEPLESSATAMLLEKDIRVDYLEVADADSLEPVDHWDGCRKLVALAAGFVDDVRLIDNMPLN